MPGDPDARVTDVEIFFTALLGLATAGILWFSAFVVYRLLRQPR